MVIVTIFCEVDGQCKSSGFTSNTTNECYNIMNGTEPDYSRDILLEITTLLCFSTSTIALVGTQLLVMCGKFKSTIAENHRNWNLAFAQITWLFLAQMGGYDLYDGNQLSGRKHILCSVFAAIAYLAWLTSFFWTGNLVICNITQCISFV